MKDIVERQFRELATKHKNLILDEVGDGRYKVKGKIGFTSSANGNTIQDRYDVEILISSGYPNLIPSATEVGGRIPEDFHRHPDKSLCLAAPLEEKRKFDQTKTLIGFVESLVIPYLFQFSFYEKYGELPFGDLSHGAKGIIEYYTELFGVDNNISALSLLKILAEDNYRGHHKCPCGSGHILRKCHGPDLLNLKLHMPHANFVKEYSECILEIGKLSGVPRILKSNKVVKFLKNVF